MTLILRVKLNNATYIASDSQVNDSNGLAYYDKSTRKPANQIKLINSGNRLTVGISGILSYKNFNYYDFIKNEFTNLPTMDIIQLQEALNIRSTEIPRNGKLVDATALSVYDALTSKNYFLTITTVQWLCKEVNSDHFRFKTKDLNTIAEHFALDYRVIKKTLSNKLFRSTFDTNFDAFAPAEQSSNHSSIIYCIVAAAISNCEVDITKILSINRLVVVELIEKVFNFIESIKHSQNLPSTYFRVLKSIGPLHIIEPNK